MSRIINGKPVHYDYTKMIAEIAEEIVAGLSRDDEIQILRGRPRESGYRPILDWYFKEDEMYLLCSPEDDDTVAGLRVKRHALRHYESVKPKLETIRVSDMMAEMEELNTL